MFRSDYPIRTFVIHPIGAWCLTNCALGPLLIDSTWQIPFPMFPILPLNRLWQIYSIMCRLFALRQLQAVLPSFPLLILSFFLNFSQIIFMFDWSINPLLPCPSHLCWSAKVMFMSVFLFFVLSGSIHTLIVFSDRYYWLANYWFWIPKFT